ncbi:MAG: hypothetical protein ACRD2U_09965 [Terriglobales bacterium]
MDQELVKWLNMVWGALEEQDSDKRAEMLVYANAFLEQTRGHAPGGVPFSVIERPETAPVFP